MYLEELSNMLKVIIFQLKYDMVTQFKLQDKKITAIFYSDYDLLKIIRKNYECKKLSLEENHKFDRA